MKFILKTYSILRMNYFFVDFIQENHNFECLGLGFPIAISLHAIARNFAQLFSNCDCELLRVYMACNCAQVKSTCVGNPS